jgi:hypothetical protein
MRLWLVGRVLPVSASDETVVLFRPFGTKSASWARPLERPDVTPAQRPQIGVNFRWPEPGSLAIRELSAWVRIPPHFPASIISLYSTGEYRHL